MKTTVEGTATIYDGWNAEYQDVRSPPTPDLIGRLCVVGLPDGRVMVADLKGSDNGRFDLGTITGAAMLASNVALDWAAPVISLRQRKTA